MSGIYFAQTSSRSSSDLSRGCRDRSEERTSTKTKLGKMCCGNATIIVFSLFLILFCDTTSSECTQLAPCICALPDYYYNLTGLADAETFVDNKSNLTVYFHPCTNVKIKIEDNTTCGNGNVSLCMYKQKNQTLIGTIEETQMKLLPGDNFPIFEIHHNDTKFMISIICYTKNRTSFAFDTPNSSPNSKEYYFTLVSPYGCKIPIKKDSSEKGLSTGSVLVILFFICAGTYFIGGIIVLKALRGATGWEMVPNHDFWCKLPSLVKDGVVFTFNCCRVDSYERI